MSQLIKTQVNLGASLGFTVNLKLTRGKDLGIYHEVYMGRTCFPGCVPGTLMKLLSNQKNWEEG